MGQRKRAIASTTALAVAGGTLAVLAVTSEGYSATRVDLNDGGVWVTRPGQVGRLNVPLEMLDQSLAPVAHEVDVIQDGADVFRVQDDGEVSRIDPARVEASARMTLPSGYVFDARGGTGAVLDPGTGKVWVRQVGEVLGLDFETVKDHPDLSVGPAAAMVVGADGTVHALSTKTDEVISVKPVVGGLGEQVKTPLGVNIVEGSITAVGGTPVVLDIKGNTIVIPGGRTVSLGDLGHPVLQQAGGAAASALVAGDGELVAVPFADGQASPVQKVPGSGATAPVQLGGCLYGAWNQTPWVVISCNGTVTENKEVPDTSGTAALKLRVNRTFVTLNDVKSGKLWTLDKNLHPAKDNWEESQPAKAKQTTTAQTDPGTESTVQAVDHQAKDRPPVANPDSYGARPGRASILPVLDNDTDPDGDVLVIKAVDAVPPSSGRLELIRGGQALQFTPDPSAAGNAVSFHYTVDDGRGLEAKTSVTVDVRQPDDPDGAPVPVPGRISSTVVQVGQTVNYNVLGDWQDPDGDPLQLRSATSSDPSDTVRWNPDGTVTLIAGTLPSKRVVSVTVSDGEKDTAGKLSVSVKPEGPLDPSARPDHYVATVGQQLVLRPLENDNDPNGDEVRLVSIEKRTDAGLTVQEDPRSGTVMFRAQKPGAYTFLYYISGGAKPVPGVIRVDVTKKGKNAPPVPVLDIAALSPDLTALIDVIANDYDPDGDVLVVSGVTDKPGLSISVREHRVLQVRASKVPDHDLVLTYFVSDGNSDPVQGSVVVRAPVFGNGKNQPPVANPDQAVVRAGDVVTVKPLANDTDPDGDKLTLLPTLTGLDPADGLAFVSGDTIRFQAPAEPKSVQIVYSVTDGKDVTSSRVTIRIRKADPKDNQPPLPLPLESRAVSGADGKVAIPVPLDGIDPDGDSVRLTGIEQPAAHLGSVVVKEGTLIYTPRLNASGTDVFGYKVTDTYGASAIGLVRVGVVAPTGANQDPTPVDDFVAATPGKKVMMDVLANDSDPDGQPVRFYTGKDHPAIEFQPGVNAKLVGSRIQVTVPPDGKTAGLVYWVEDGSGGVASATLTVVGSAKITNLPPVARDDYAPEPAANDSSVSVKVLANDEDPDGSQSALKVTRVLPDSATANATVSANGQSVTAQLADHARVVPYEITDGQDTALAFIFVPAKTVNRPPVLRDGAHLDVEAGGPPTTFDLSTYVVDPEGQPVRLGANDKVQGDNLGQAAAASPTSITYTPAAKSSGDGSISFEVIDGPTIQDSVNVVLLTLPVTVTGVTNNPPKVRAGSMNVAQGEAARTLDISTLVTDDPGDSFTVSDLQVGGAGVDVQLNGTVLSAQAAADAQKGQTPKATFTVTDKAGATAKGSVIITVTGSSKPLAKIADKTFDKAEAGKPVTVNLADQVAFNPFPSSPLKIISAKAVSGPGNVTFDSNSVTVTPAPNFHGQVSVLYKVQDETGDPDRVVDGRIVLTVQAAPDKPAAPTRVSSGDSKARISWPAPSANGSQITSYMVAWAGGSKDCGTATECQITGLTNGTTYHFTVQAINGVGSSPVSDPSEGITPDIAPANAPTPSVTRPDTNDGGVLQIAWGPFENKGSQITTCDLSNGVQDIQVPCDGGNGAGNYTWSSLTNGQSYAFRIRASNAAGTSDWSGTSDPGVGIPAGHPKTPGAPSAKTAGGDIGKQVAVDWPAADGNGVPIIEYTLTVKKAGAVENTLTFPGGTTAATIDVTTNGAQYTFSVKARNEVGSSADGPDSAAVVPFGAPFQVGAVTATPGDKSITLAFTDPNDNGQALVKREAQRNDGQIFDLAGGNTIGGLTNGTSYTFAVRACNSLCGPWSTPSAAQIPFGPPGTPTVNAAVADATHITLSWNAPAPNGRDITSVQVSVNGGGFTDQPINGSTTVAVARGAGATIVARAVDAAGQTGPTSAQASATTPPPPPPTVSVYNDRGYVGISVSNWPHDGLIGCFIGAPTNNWQRNILVSGGSGSNSSQIGTGTTWFYQGVTTVDCEGVKGTG